MDTSLGQASELVAQLDVPLTGDQEAAGSPPPGRKYSFVEI